jgi:capsular exopolysaccharide synthesis family protein
MKDAQLSGDRRDAAPLDRHFASGYPPSPARPIAFVRRNWLLIAACAGTLVATTALFTSRLTPKYQASASIRIEEEEQARLGVGSSGTSTLNELPTEVEILQSRGLAEAVTDSLALRVELHLPANVPRDLIFSHLRVLRVATPGQYRLERIAAGRFSLRDRSTGASLGQVIPGTPAEIGGLEFVLSPRATWYASIDFAVSTFDDAVDALQRTLRIGRRSREANLIDVTYTGHDPLLVQQVPNVLAARFVMARQSERHAQARSAAEFLSGQIAILSDQLSAAEDSLRAFEERRGVVSLPEEAGTGLTRMAELQAKRDGIEAERSALAALVAAVRDSMQRDPSMGVLAYRNLVAFPTLLHNEPLTQTLGLLTTVEDRRSDLLSRRSPDDADVRLLSARANQLADQLGAIALEYLQGLADQVSALDVVLARSRQQLDQIPAKQLEFARRQRQAKGLEEIVTLLQSRLKEAQIAEAVEDPSVRLVDAAVLPRVPVSPKPLLNLCLALVLGVVLGTSGAMLRDRMDRTVRTRQDVLGASGVPLLGLLPRARHEDVPARMIRGDAALPLVEAYHLLGTNLAYAVRDASAKVFAVTSALPGEGKTTVAVNLATTLTRRGLRVLLIDGDLRQGTVASLLGMARTPGLSDVLMGTVPFGTAASMVPVRGTGSLHVLSRGTASENPIHLLGSLQVGALLGALREQFDTIVVDTPPVNVVADASVIATQMDAVIVVARAAFTEAHALALALNQLAHARAAVVGTVLNDIDFRRDAAYDDAYRYYAHAYPSPQPVRQRRFRFLPHYAPHWHIAAGLATTARSAGDAPE